MSHQRLTLNCRPWGCWISVVSHVTQSLQICWAVAWRLREKHPALAWSQDWHWAVGTQPQPQLCMLTNQTLHLHQKMSYKTLSVFLRRQALAIWHLPHSVFRGWRRDNVLIIHLSCSHILPDPCGVNQELGHGGDTGERGETFSSELSLQHYPKAFLMGAAIDQLRKLTVLLEFLLLLAAGWHHIKSTNKLLK